MSWALISDSSCNLRDWQPTAPHTTFAFAPLKIRVGEREFVDDLSLDVHELNCAVQAETNASSSACPSVGEWAELFKLADKTICMPISEGVSGSYNAAATARDMVLAEEPNRQIHLVNSRAAGGKMEEAPGVLCQCFPLAEIPIFLPTQKYFRCERSTW